MIQDPFRSMIRSEGCPALSRPSVAPHARPVYHLALRGHAAADAGAARGDAHAGVARSLSDCPGTRSGRPFRCLGCVAGDGLQSPRPGASQGCAVRCEGLGRGVSARDARSGRAARHWPGNGAGHPFVCIRSSGRVSGDQRAHGLFASFLSRCAGRSRSRAGTADPSRLSGGLGAAADEIAPFAAPQDDADTPRAWYYALLDYGAYLKKTLPNPSRRSAGYSRQSKFEGSRRQKRAHIVRMLLAARDGQPTGITLDEAVAGVNEMETAAGREPVERELVASILADLEREGFCRSEGDRWLSV